MKPGKIVVIGPESTGKSTLSSALAAELGTQWVPEYARAYLEQLEKPYAEEDLLEIAKGQLENEDALARAADKILVCDTDLYVLKVWSENAFGRCHKWILEQIAVRAYDLYLLTDIDMPWQDDPLREHSAPDMRRYFYHQYREIVQQSGVPWVLVNGNEEQRLQIALQAVAQLC